jgi:predicted dehydrogenase
MPRYLEIPELDFLGVYDVDEGRAEAALKKYEGLKTERGIESDITPRVYSSIDEIMNDDRVEMVDVCTPPFARDMVVDLLNVGKNVCAEKPMTRNYLEAKPLAEAAKDSGSLFQHNENWCYDGYHYTLQKLIRHDLGVPFVGTYSEGHGGPEGREWFWDPELGGGGTLLDNGIHPITGSWYLLGFEEWEPVRVKTIELGIKYPWRMLGGFYQRVQVEDHAHVKIMYENGSGDVSMALVEASWSWTYLSSFVQSERGSARREGDEIVLDLYGFGERRVRFPGINGTYGELNNFVQCILRGKPSMTNEDVGLRSMAMVGATYLSKLRGRPVEIDEFVEWAEGIGDHEKLRHEMLKACR